MKKDRDCRIIRLGDRILRILDAEGEKALVIDCVKMGMPKWISLSEIEDGVEIPGEEFMGQTDHAREIHCHFRHPALCGG